jgi:hypothetical protein
MNVIVKSLPELFNSRYRYPRINSSLIGAISPLPAVIKPRGTRRGIFPNNTIACFGTKWRSQAEIRNVFATDMTPGNFGNVPPRIGRRIAGVHLVADFNFMRLQFPVPEHGDSRMGSIGAALRFSV